MSKTRYQKRDYLLKDKVNETWKERRERKRKMENKK